MELSLPDMGDAFTWVDQRLIVNQYRPIWKGEKDVFPDEIPVLVTRGECELLNPRAAKRWFANPLTEDQLKEAYQVAIEEAKNFIARRTVAEDAYFILMLIPAHYPSGAYRLFPYLLETRKDQLPVVLASLAEYLANMEMGIYVNLTRAL